MTIDFIYFEGCPNAAEARANLRTALEQAGLPAEWHERDLLAPSTPEAFRRYGSPVVLIDGRDVLGEAPSSTGPACRTGPAPTVEAILTQLRRSDRVG
jgi:hypothetical protein